MAFIYQERCTLILQRRGLYTFLFKAPTTGLEAELISMNVFHSEALMEPVRAKLHNIIPIMPPHSVAEHMATAHKARYSEVRGSEILTYHLSTRYNGFSIMLQKTGFVACGKRPRV